MHISREVCDVFKIQFCILFAGYFHCVFRKMLVRFEFGRINDHNVSAYSEQKNDLRTFDEIVPVENVNSLVVFLLLNFNNFFLFFANQTMK